MNNERIKEIALANGHSLFTMPDGTEDIHPHVYEFARALMTDIVNDEIKEHQDCIDSLSGVPESVKEYARDSILDLQGKLAELDEVTDD